jgi:ubiquinone/menaquinone biosynthesis C-methylase UbiE
MKYYLTRFWAVLLPAALIAGCESAPPAPEEPTLLRTESATSRRGERSELETLPSVGTGGFESLVTDYDTDRAIWQKPDMVISLLGDLSGKTVADIGAGTGYFAFRLVPRAEKVIAIEIDRGMIAFMDSVKVRLPVKLQAHFETRLARPEDPLLKPDEADAVIIVNTYGYIEHREDYMRRLARGMSEGGRLLIIDFKKNNLNVGPPDQFKVSVRQVEHELRNAGYEVAKIDNESLDFQYIILASKKTPE